MPESPVVEREELRWERLGPDESVVYLIVGGCPAWAELPDEPGAARPREAVDPRAAERSERPERGPVPEDD